MKKKIIIAFSIVLLVAALITGWVFWKMSKNPDKNSDIPSTIQVTANEASGDVFTEYSYTAADGDSFIYSPETKTLIVSGEKIDADISKAENNPQCTEWFKNAEKIVFAEGVTENATSFERFEKVKLIEICSTMHAFSASHTMPSLEKYVVSPDCERFYSDEYGVLYSVCYDKSQTEGNNRSVIIKDIPYNIPMTEFTLNKDFSNNSLKTKNIKKYIFDKDFSVGVHGGTFYDFTNIEFYEVHPQNMDYCSDEQGILYSKDKTKIYAIPSTVEEFVMPENSHFDFTSSYRIYEDISPAVNSSVRKITVSNGLNDFDDLLYFSNLEEIVILESNDNYCMVDGIVFSKDMSKIVFYPPMKEGEVYEIPSSVTSIGSWCFASKTLKNIIVSDSVKNISWGAFRFAKALETVKIGEGVEEIHWFHVATFDTYNPFEYCDNLKYITVDKDNGYYCNDKYGNLYTKDMKILMTYPAASPYKEFTVPDSVEEFGYAFKNCKNIEVINIGKNTTYVNWYHYSEYGYGHGFAECVSLRAINVSEDNPKYCSKDGIVYSKDMSKIILYPQGKTAESFNVPESVKYFYYGGYGTFYNNPYLKKIYVLTKPSEIIIGSLDGAAAPVWLPDLKLTCEIYWINEDGKTFIKSAKPPV